MTNKNSLEEFAVGEVADEGQVGGEEVEVGEAGDGGPLHLLEDAVGELAVVVEDGEELDFDGAAVAVVVADGGDAGADGGVDAELFVELAGEGLLGGFAGFDLAAGELPLEGHGLVGAALADEDLAGGGAAFRVAFAQDERGHDAAERPRGRRGVMAVEFADGLLHVSPCL